MPSPWGSTPWCSASSRAARAGPRAGWAAFLPLPAFLRRRLDEAAPGSDPPRRPGWSRAPRSRARPPRFWSRRSSLRAGPAWPTRLRAAACRRSGTSRWWATRGRRAAQAAARATPATTPRGGAQAARGGSAAVRVQPVLRAPVLAAWQAMPARPARTGPPAVDGTSFPVASAGASSTQPRPGAGAGQDHRRGAGRLGETLTGAGGVGRTVEALGGAVGVSPKKTTDRLKNGDVGGVTRDLGDAVKNAPNTARTPPRRSKTSRTRSRSRR